MEEVATVELNDYLRILRRNWILVLAGCLVGVMTAAGVALMSKPVYTAQTGLFVAIQGSATVSELQQGNSFTQARIQSYVSTAVTPAVLQPVIDRLGLATSADDLSSRVAAKTSANTVLIDITASDESPVRAAAIAQAVGESLVETVESLEKPAGAATSPVKLSVVRPAVAPASPSSPNISRTLLLGLISGLVAGLVGAFARGTLDTRLRNETDLKHVTTAPLLGAVAYDSDAVNRPLLTHAHGQNTRAESFRQIRTNLQFAHVTKSSKTVLISSSLPGEGKSTTAINTAISLTQAGQRVVLVDADLRRPMIANYLGLERGAGLTTALLGTARWEDLVQPWGEDGLNVLASGQIPPNPSELLGSATMARLIREMEGAFDCVVIDAPPLIPVTDAAILSQIVGGVVLVVGSGKIKSPDLAKAIASLDLVDASILGVVLNMIPTKGPDAYAYSYYAYESQPESRREAKGSPPKGFNGSHMKAARKTRSSSNFDQILK